MGMDQAQRKRQILIVLRGDEGDLVAVPVDGHRRLQRQAVRREGRQPLVQRCLVGQRPEKGAPHQQQADRKRGVAGGNHVGRSSRRCWKPSAKANARPPPGRPVR